MSFARARARGEKETRQNKTSTAVYGNVANDSIILLWLARGKSPPTRWNFYFSEAAAAAQPKYLSPEELGKAIIARAIFHVDSRVLFINTNRLNFTCNCKCQLDSAMRIEKKILRKRSSKKSVKLKIKLFTIFFGDWRRSKVIQDFVGRFDDSLNRDRNLCRMSHVKFMLNFMFRTCCATLGAIESICEFCLALWIALKLQFL